MPRRPIDPPVKITGDRASHARYGVGPATDYACPTGTPVRAPFPGTTKALWNSLGGFIVALVGEDATFYGHHLSKRMPTKAYAEGDIIALSGNTGLLTTGPHLHCYVILHTTGERLSMEEYLTAVAATESKPFTPPPQEETLMRIINVEGVGIYFTAPGIPPRHVTTPEHVRLLERLIRASDPGDDRETFNAYERDILAYYLAA